MAGAEFERASHETVHLGLIVLCTFALAADRSAAPEYFKYSRGVHVADTKTQTYFAMDLTMWEHMRADLGDMRIYSQGVEVPYTLEVQRGGRSLSQVPAKLLDLGTRGHATELSWNPMSQSTTRLR